MTALVTAAVYTALIATLALGAGVAIISIRHDLMNPRVREEMAKIAERRTGSLVCIVASLFRGRAA